MAVELSATGIRNWQNSDTTPPRLEEIAMCREWITQFCTPRKTPNRFRSYGLKHMVERYFSTDKRNEYVSNGAFIQAAIDCGFEPIPDGINAKFCFWIHKEGFKGSEGYLNNLRLTHDRI
jgi:hypothetical protein